MPKSILYLFIAFCFLAACKPQDELVYLSVSDQIERLAEGTIGIGTQHALSIAVYTEGDWQRFHFGIVNPNQLDRPNDSTLYAIGEISETFTATLLADQVLSSNLSFADSLVNRWPENVPAFNGAPIRLSDLATHTAGLASDPIDTWEAIGEEARASYFKDFGQESLYALFANQTLNEPPALSYEAAPLGMVVLAHLLELRNNQAYFELLRDDILLPNQMSDTRDLLNMPQSLADKISPAWDIISRPLPHYQFGEYQGSQSLYSNLDDMIRWADIQIAPFHPLSDAVDLCLQAHFSLDGERAVGYGWQMKALNSTPYYFKEGNVHHASHIRVSPEESQAMIILSNTDNLPEIRWMADIIWNQMQF